MLVEYSPQKQVEHEFSAALCSALSQVQKYGKEGVVVPNPFGKKAGSNGQERVVDNYSGEWTVLERVERFLISTEREGVLFCGDFRNNQSSLNEWTLDFPNQKIRRRGG